MTKKAPVKKVVKNAEKARTLNARQKKFVAEYLIDLNATKAAIRSGYSENTARQTGQENMTKPVIKAAVDAALAERVERTKVDQDYVINTIVDTIERCRQHKPVRDKAGNLVYVETEDGDTAPAYAFDAQSVLRGADLLAKHVGLYEADNKQKSPLDGLPRDVLKMVVDKLRGA